MIEETEDVVPERSEPPLPRDFAPPRIPPFVLVLFAWTALAHVTVGLAAFAGARAARIPCPALIAIGIAVVAALPFRGRMLSLMPDRRRPAWRVALVDLPYFAHWCAATLASCAMIGAVIAWLALRVVRGPAPFDLIDAAAWTYLAGALLSAWGVWIRRRWVRTRSVEIGIRGLPKVWDAYRIVQLSDLHLGSFDTARSGLRWARQAVELRPDLIAVTGDLLTSGEDFFEDVAEVIAALRAPDGALFVPGNHDYFGAPGELFRLVAHRGVRVLRNESVRVERAGTTLVIAGVDDTWTRHADLERALSGREGAAATVLLAHDPDLFPLAARASVDLVLSGHTHGGQVAVPFLARWLNISRRAHSFHLGLYERGRSKLYVSAGLGVTGPPIRIGAAPEVTVITLRSIAPEAP
ncbi:MAG TPA: metallophosphoesterase [Polyangiaceae bacterium]|nr:metallophosphoesterase [Polyangiaceae bacterium]